MQNINVSKWIRNAALAIGAFVLAAGVVAGTATQAEAQSAPQYGNCPAGYSRRANFMGGLVTMPSGCWLSQCKPYAPSPGHVTYAAKYQSCQLLPGSLPGDPGTQWCTKWLYQIAPAEAGPTACPIEVQNGGDTHWVSN